MKRNKSWQKTKEDKDHNHRYIICPCCGDKVYYMYRSGHRCFKRYLKEFDMGLHQMTREFKNWGPGSCEDSLSHTKS